MTFQSLYDLYIEDMTHRLRRNTLEGKKNVFALGYADAYLDRIQNMMTTIMNYAVTYYNLPSNPCTKAGHMGKRTKSMKFWTLDQYNKFISHITDISAYTGLQVLFYSGVRLGELLALTPNDIDFSAGTININKSIQIKATGNLVTPPKTSNSIRVITMPKEVMSEIKAYMDRQYDLQENERIFTYTKALIRNNMIRGSEKANVPFIRIHDLRHSHVSLLIELGFSAQLIAERIGDTVQMVNGTYGHLYPTRHQEVADKLNSIIVPN